MTGSPPELRVLVTTCEVPWPARTGKGMRSRLLCEVAASFGALDVLVLATPDPPGSTISAPQGGAGTSVTLIPPTDRSTPTALICAAARAWPGILAIRDWSQANEYLQTKSTGYDLVVFGSLDHAEALGKHVQARRTVIDMDDIETAKIDSFLAAPRTIRLPRGAVARAKLDRILWRRLERMARRSSATVLVASELDHSRLGNPAAFVVPNYYPNTSPIHPLPRTQNIGLVANFAYPPNADAALFAATEIMPLLLKMLPTAHLKLIGRSAHTLPATIRSAEGIEIVGQVESVSQAMRDCAVSLAPVRFGGGTRIKIIEAFALGIPAVATSTGSEGLGAQAGKQLLVADTATALAAACCQIIQDEQLATALSTNGRELFETRFSFEHSRAALRVALNAALGS